MEQVSTQKNEESVSTCFNCKNEIADGASYCNNCGSQIKCKVCKSILDERASFCSTCGERVILNLQPEGGANNFFDYTQKGDSKKVKAKFTNEVGGYFAGFFNSMVSGHPIPARNPFKNSLQLTSSKNSNGNTFVKDVINNIQDAEVITDYSAQISKIFKESETGKLEIIDNRLKEKSKLDKAKRLAILFLFAKKLTGIESVSREELNEVITREKLADGNYRSFLVKDGLKYFSTKENGNFSLLVGGEDYAKEIIEQIANPDFKPTTSKAGRKGGKRNSNVSSDNFNAKESKSNKSSNPSALEMCKTLIKEEYFANKRKLNDIVEYSDQKKAVKYSSQNLQYALNRLVKDQTLDREKNNNGQYEYYKK